MEKKNLLKKEVHTLGRKLSTHSILFHQAIAAKIGLSFADHKYLDILLEKGSMTAGRLAELTGLTTGAVTGVIDRLEKDGFVKREKDIKDRRKVLVVLDHEKATKQIEPVFMEMQEDLDNLHNDFSENELATIIKYLKETTAFYEKMFEKLNR